MDKIQLIFFFINGFFVSRLIIKVKLPHRIVFWFVGKKHLSLSRILLYLIVISAFLSFFIPNAITILTLLPLLELIRRAYEESNNSPKSIATMLALCAIYGANIGGMGSVTATPANGILVTYAVLNNVSGTQYLSFASWLAWGIPLVIVFVAIAWLILIAVLRPWKYRDSVIRLPFDEARVYHPLQKLTVWITVFYFLSSFILSIFMMYVPDQTLLILIVTGILSLLLSLFLFLVPVNGADESKSKAVLLELPDCYNELPTRGFIFVGIAVALAAILYAFQLHEFFSKWAVRIMPTDVSIFVLLFAIAVMTSFATEILSNTAVQLSFFVMALPLAETLGFSALAVLIIITLGCTSAFMSPIATGVNGLAFGGVKGVSFSRMLVAGFVMNIVGALLISIWTLFVVGRFYGLF